MHAGPCSALTSPPTADLNENKPFHFYLFNFDIHSKYKFRYQSLCALLSSSYYHTAFADPNLISSL